MNVLRALTKHQKYFLGEIAKGHEIITFDVELNSYISKLNHDSEFYTVISHGKPRGNRFSRCGNHFQKAVVTLIQRKMLVNIDGRLFPSKEAAKVFGYPPPLPVQKPFLKMWRTRAARDQSS